MTTTTTTLPKTKKVEPKEQATETIIETAVTEAKPYSCLIDKKVRIRPIPHNRNLLTNNVSESTMFIGTSRSIILPKDKTGRYVKALSYEEQEYLEQRLGVNLDPYKDKDNYWDKVRLTIRKDAADLDLVYAELDLSVPHDFLIYKMCLVAPEVANSATEEFELSQIFFIEDQQVDDVKKFTIEEEYDRINEYRLKIKGNRVALFNFLRSLAVKDKSIKVTRKTSIENMYNTLGSLSRDSKKMNMLMDALDEIEKDESAYLLRLLVLDGIEIGEILNTNRSFTTVDGTSLGASLDEAVLFFKDPRNAKIKARIQQQIELQLT